MQSRNTSVVNIFLITIAAVFIIEKVVNIPLVEYFGLKDFRSPKFQPYQFITHFFLHADLMHLLRNGFAFLVFGRRLEYMLGRKYFIYLILFSGIGAAVIQSGVGYVTTNRIKDSYEVYIEEPTPEHLGQVLSHFNPRIKHRYSNLVREYITRPNNPDYISVTKEIVEQLYQLKLSASSVGASGIIFAFLMCFAMLFPNELLFLIFIPIPIKAKYFTIFYGLYELYQGAQNNPADNVAHFAHLGGMLFGYLFIKYMREWRYKWKR